MDVIRRIVAIVVVMGFFNLSSIAMAVSAECDDALSILRKAKAYADSLSDYTLTLHKKERIKSSTGDEEVVTVKWKKPGWVYLKYLAGKNKGREILYVPGKYNNKMLVSSGGIFDGLTMRVSPDNAIVKMNSRHSITEAGMPKTIARIIDDIEKGAGDASSRMKVKMVGPEDREGNRCLHIRVIGSDYADRAEVFLYETSLLLAGISSYDDSDALIESFRYEEIKTNVGLSESDFDSKNEAYHF